SVCLRGNVRLSRSLLSVHYAEDVCLTHDEKLLALHPDGLPRIFSEQHPVSYLDVERHERAFVGPLSLADRRDLALVGLLGRGVRDDDAGRGLLFLVKTLDDDAIV